MKTMPWWIYVGVALVIVMGALFGGQEDGVSGMGQPRTAASDSRTAADASTEEAAQERFDYFPDRFQNQAKEPAEPIATF
jgi:hypothetical protein